MAYVHEIKAVPPFNELFPIKPETYEAVKQSMARGGYDPAHPIIVWRETDIIVDGHTRYRAAVELGLNYVQTFHKSFANEDEALEYAIEQQTQRRNLTDAEIIRCIEALDRRRQRGGDRKSINYQAKSKPPNGGIDSGKSASAKETAKLVGVSPRKVERARTVLAQADEATKAAVKEGKISIHRAYEATRAKTASPASNPAMPEQTQAAPAQAQAAAPATADPAPGQAAEPQSDRHKQELRQALEELLAWRQKYRHLVELSYYFEAIDSWELCQIRLVKG